MCSSATKLVDNFENGSWFEDSRPVVDFPSQKCVFFSFSSLFLNCSEKLFGTIVFPPHGSRHFFVSFFPSITIEKQSVPSQRDQSLFSSATTSHNTSTQHFRCTIKRMLKNTEHHHRHRQVTYLCVRKTGVAHPRKALVQQHPVRGLAGGPEDAVRVGVIGVDLDVVSSQGASVVARAEVLVLCAVGLELGVDPGRFGLILFVRG